MRRFIKLGATGALIIIFLIVPIMGMLITISSPAISVELREPQEFPNYAPTVILPRNQTEIWVNRTVWISEFLFVKVVDEINITNTKGELFSAMQIYYPLKFWRKVMTLKVLGSYRNDSFRSLDFTINYKSVDYVGLVVKFYTLLDKYVSVLRNTFKLRLIFQLREGLFEIKPFNNKMGLFLNLTPCPFLPYSIKSLTVKFISPEGTNLEFDEVKPVSGKTLVNGKDLQYSKEDIPPMDLSLGLTDQLKRYGFESEIKAVWSTDSGLPIIRHAERSVTITRSYLIIVEDHFVVSLYSFGEPAENPEESKWKLSSIRIGLAKNVSEVLEVRDDIGKLTYSKTSDEDIPEDVYTIRIDFKSPIIAGELRNVYVKYTIKLGEGFVDNGKFNVSVPLLPLVNTTVHTARLCVKAYVPTKIIMPINCEAEFFETGAEKFFVVQFSQVVLAFKSISPGDNGAMVLLFEYDLTSLLSSYYVLLAYIMIVTILLAEALLAAKWAMTRYVTPKEVKRLRKLERFIMNYETIIASDKELWAEAYRNLMLRRPTAAFIDELSKRYSRLNEKINVVMAAIRGLREIVEIFDYLVELGKVEERIRIFKQRIIEVASQYVRGEVSDEIFETRMEALLLDLKDDLNNRERILNTIRDFYISKAP